jgi:uncharacterized membrane protein
MRTVNRMVIATAALLGLFVATYLLLYKLGAFPALICGAGGACETVQASPYAYFLGVPVAAWGTLAYVVMLTVAFLGTQPRFESRPWVGVALLVLTAGAFLFSLYLSFLEEFVIGAWCRWCVVSAILSTIAFLAALPEIGRLRRDPGPSA